MNDTEALCTRKVSHYCSVNKFMDSLKELITYDVKFIQVYIDEISEKLCDTESMDTKNKTTSLKVLIWVL